MAKLVAKNPQTAKLKASEYSSSNGKMDLAPLNPTAEEIAALPNGQLYSDTVNHKGVIKGGQGFYDMAYIDDNYRRTYITSEYPPFCLGNFNYNVGDIWVVRSSSDSECAYICTHIFVREGYRRYRWRPISQYIIKYSTRPSTETIRYVEAENGWRRQKHEIGDIITEQSTNSSTARLLLCTSVLYSAPSESNWSRTVTYDWREIMTTPYVPTNISAFTNDSGYLTLETLPIYDGTVI